MLVGLVWKLVVSGIAFAVLMGMAERPDRISKTVLSKVQSLYAMDIDARDMARTARLARKAVMRMWPEFAPASRQPAKRKP